MVHDVIALLVNVGGWQLEKKVKSFEEYLLR